jgi:hypothetical protein
VLVTGTVADCYQPPPNTWIFGGKLARYLNVTPQWVRFVKNIGCLHCGEHGRFSAKEMAHFLTEVWIALKAISLVQRGNRLARNRHAETAPRTQLLPFRTSSTGMWLSLA